jgi:hypothetical protein
MRYVSKRGSAMVISVMQCDFSGPMAEKVGVQHRGLWGGGHYGCKGRKPGSYTHLGTHYRLLVPTILVACPMKGLEGHGQGARAPPPPPPPPPRPPPGEKSQKAVVCRHCQALMGQKVGRKGQRAAGSNSPPRFCCCRALTRPSISLNLAGTNQSCCRSVQGSDSTDACVSLGRWTVLGAFS